MLTCMWHSCTGPDSHEVGKVKLGEVVEALQVHTHYRHTEADTHHTHRGCSWCLCEERGRWREVF